ncbi:Cation-transporting P-type ATPase [Cynara cardunculus var. scolymus]|uniref:Cation-transporting P-type ATPase n=1 Tax=Cynara cardunculus var. scolymus TaxID=59895 RepID=A0A103YKY0_CYNCS|nr:Cation-transporting P-type ATPase [Cynara cardunculus var. scolymus]
MEATLSVASTTTLFSTAVGHACRSQLALLHSRRFTTTANTVFRRSPGKLGLKSPLFRLRAAVPSVWCRFECLSSSAASFASPSGDGEIGGGGEVNANPVAGGVDVSVLSSDVIILDVGDMMCGGCAASVKRILESQVSSASVNHTTETAIIWPLPEAKATPNWQKVMGEQLAKHLTACGFSSNLRGEAASEGEPS